MSKKIASNKVLFFHLKNIKKEAIKDNVNGILKEYFETAISTSIVSFPNPFVVEINFENVILVNSPLFLNEYILQDIVIAANFDPTFANPYP